MDEDNKGEYGCRHQAGPSGDKDRFVFRSDNMLEFRISLRYGFRFGAVDVGGRYAKELVKTVPTGLLLLPYYIGQKARDFSLPL